MFQWSYFFLYALLGFGAGYSSPNVSRGGKPNPTWHDPLMFICILCFFGSFLFGPFWVIVTAIEMGVGYYFGKKIAGDG